MKKGFKIGNKYTPTKARIEELERIETAYKALRLRIDLKPLTDDMAMLFGLITASRPMSQWPKDTRTIFDESARKFPTLAQLYKINHKEVHKE